MHLAVLNLNSGFYITVKCIDSPDILLDTPC